MGIPFEPRATWLLNAAKAREYDYLVGMDAYNIADLRRLVYPEDLPKLHKLLYFAGKLSKYRGRYIAISDGKVLGDYDDFDVGVDTTVSSGHALGTFMVHLCVPREEETPFLVARNSRSAFLRKDVHRFDFYRNAMKGANPIVEPI